jgi:hypothetical protein
MWLTACITLHGGTGVVRACADAKMLCSNSAVQQLKRLHTERRGIRGVLHCQCVLPQTWGHNQVRSSVCCRFLSREEANVLGLARR